MVVYAIFSGIVATICFLVARQSESKEFCHNDDFEAECPEPEEVILMTSALYGRMSLGECVKQDFGFLGCSSDVIAYTHERCSGRKSCLIRIPDQILDRTKPCNEDLKSYLDTTYDCIRVAIPESESCELVSKTDELIGFLSNNVLPVSSQRCGSTTSPWTITVLHGQRINMTLLDFSSTINYDEMVDADADTTTTMVGMETTTMTTTTTTPTGGCDQYAAFHEASSSGSSSSEKSFLCGSRMVSFSQAFLSSSNTIKVTLFHRTDHDYNFLLKYEAVGCSDVLQTPSNVWFRRDHDHMTVGCLMSEITWRLTCVRNHWEGTTANCSHTGLKDARREDGLPLLSMGASILIILSVSLGIGLVVLLFGLYYMKRKHERNAFGVQMRDLKPLQPDSSASYAAGAAAGVSSSSSPGVLPRSSGPVSAGPTASASAASASSAFEPSVRLNVTRIDPSIRRGKGCLSSTACNAEDGSDYEYVWNMSPATPVSSSTKRIILPKLRPKQQNPHLHLQQQQQQPHLHQRPETMMMSASTSRPPIDLNNRPDLVSKLEGADDALGRSNSGSSSGGGPGGFPIPIPVAAAAATGIQCTCRLEDRRRATTTATTAATSSRSTDDVLGSPQRIRVKPRQGSGEESAAVVPAPPPPHRQTPDSRPSSTTTTPTSGAGITTTAPRPEVTDACRRVCRHCGHAVLEGGPGSVRFAPGTGTTAIVHDVPGFGSVAKRSVPAAAGEDATTMKRGFNPSIVTIPQQHKH